MSGIAASLHYLSRSPSRVFAVGSDSFRFRHHPKPNFDTAARGDVPADAGVAAGSGIMDDHFTHIGTREIWGGIRPVSISLPDRRQHLYIIGKTGSGKTTLLRNLIVQHLAAGHGVGLIDPHGDLADELLDCIPPHRADDLVYFNPGDLDFPIGLNPLANVAPDDRHLVASGIVGSFKSIWRDSWGPRLEYILYNAIAALLDCPNTSLLGVNRMLTDADYRRRIVSKVRDPFVRAFWTDEYENYDPRFQREAIAPIQNKLGQFIQNPVIRNILGQVRSKVSIPFMMDTGRIFLANLSKGKLGADKSNLLGSLLTTQFQLAAMARVNQPEAERRDFYLFIDEFQNFTTDAFASILSEARKYRLCLTLSHQYIEQIPDPVRAAIFGNVGSLVSFRVGHIDAEALRGEFGNIYPLETFTGLDRYQILARLSEDGQTREPFRAQTLPPIEHQIGSREKFIARSRDKYAAPRVDVEEKINRWLNKHGEPRPHVHRDRIPSLPAKVSSVSRS